jgi:hypothetical protein
VVSVRDGSPNGVTQLTDGTDSSYSDCIKLRRNGFAGEPELRRGCYASSFARTDSEAFSRSIGKSCGGISGHEPTLVAKSSSPCSLLQQLPRHSEARQKDIGVILAFGDLGSKRVPNVLVAGDQSDSRCDRKIVEDLNAALVTRAGIS